MAFCWDERRIKKPKNWTLLMFSVRTIYIQFFTPPLDHKEYFSFYSLYFKTGRRTPSKNTIKKKYLKSK